MRNILEDSWLVFFQHVTDMKEAEKPFQIKEH